MNRLNIIRDNLVNGFTPRRVAAMLLGNLAMGIGVGALKLSMMGNDPFTAFAMVASESLHMGLGNFQLILNSILVICQIIWGCRYIGLGTLVNMYLVGYVVQYSAVMLERLIGSGAGHSFVYCLVYMFAALLVVSFGLSMYQKADLGIAPYDYLSIGMTEHSKIPYFANRVFTDGSCVCLILLSLAAGLIGWENSHLGVATFVCAFCLGPFVSLFNPINEKWIY